MSVETLLSRLDRVRKRGPNQWSARCPAHDDKGPSLSIHETAEGVVLLHCFADCEVADVVAAVGLDQADLFPPRTGASPPLERPQRLTDAQALDLLREDAEIIAMVACNIARGVVLSPGDRAQCLLAAGHIACLHTEVRSS